MSSIKYVSTRGADKNTSFKDAVLRGLASDGGLLVPQNIPIIPLDALELWKQLSFSQLAVEVMSCFIGEDQIPEQDLKILWMLVTTMVSGEAPILHLCKS